MRNKSRRGSCTTGNADTMEEAQSHDKVRERVNSLLRLAEMKWRYRVVEKGQSPRDEGLKLLYMAKQLLDAHRAFKARACVFMKLKQSSASSNANPASVGTGQEGAGTGAGVASSAGFRQLWAVELSSIAQGIGVTGLIFDLAVIRPRGISEEGPSGSRVREASFKSAIEEVHNYEVDHVLDAAEIEALLEEARRLREGAGMEWELADTLNSLGALSQKLQKYDAAAALYARSLELRRGRAVPAGDDEQAKAKQQGMAQSFVSLGNLEIERGDAAVAEAASDDKLPPGAARQAGATFYLAARMHMEAARDAYVHGFSSSHPKVAWALEGLAKIHEKCGDLGAALETYRQASELRRKLQESDQSKNLFHKELTYVEERRLELSDRKAKAAKLLGAALGGAPAPSVFTAEEAKEGDTALKRMMRSEIVRLRRKSASHPSP